MFSLSNGDFLAILVIIIISYWVTFKSGLSELFIPNSSNRRNKGELRLKRDKHRGRITGKTGEQSNGSIFEKVRFNLYDNLLLFL